MKISALTFVAISALLCTTRAQDFTETVKAILSQSDTTKPLAVQGSDKNWLFLRKELEHLSVGDLGTADLSKANVEGTDPLPVIQKYNEELKALGVELLLVPVPPKALIYPEKLSDKIDPKTVPSMAGFYAKLKAVGVNVLDLETVFREERAKNPDKQLYCATDTHWSPYACQLTAKLVAEKYKALPELSQSKHSNLTTLKEETLEFQGDLAIAVLGTAKEKLPFWRAGEASGTDVKTVESDPASAVLAIGDSHLQVFRKGGDMLATQGGFVDHLDVDLGAAVEEITMQAGGADGPRVEIARATAKNPDFWAKKKVVVWVFTAREFTQGKWRVIPAKFIKKS
jgi:alginate O-acetyltransferase complex protein AlgJ